MSWAREEFKTLDLGDARLDARAVLLAQRLGSKPMESIPNACSGWAETQGAYRFLSNTKTDWHALLQPHWDCSIERMRPHAVVLNIQDITEVDFRCQHDWALPEGGKLWARMAQAPQLGRVVFDLPPGRGHQARRVTQSLRADVIELADGSGAV